MGNFRKGDYVMCYYEGKEYTGCILSEQKKDFVEVQICTSSKRAEKPIFDVVSLNVADIKPITIS